MPKYYCMCQITGDVPQPARDSQGFGPRDNQVYLAPNRFAPYDEKDRPKSDDFRPVILPKPIVCLKNGVQQKVTDEPVPNTWAKTIEEAQEDIKKLKKARRHYPNVDLYGRPVCGTMMCVE